MSNYQSAVLAFCLPIAIGIGMPIGHCLFSLQLPDPNISIAHRVAMILQNKRQLFRMHFISRGADIFRTAPNGEIIFNQHAIL